MQCLWESHMTACILNVGDQAALKKKGYEVISMLGEGTYSLVYQGEYCAPVQPSSPLPKNVPMKVALKVMTTQGRTKDFLDRFLPRELTIHSRVSHPHIIHLHSILQVGTKVILATRLAERGTLLHHLTKYGEVHERQARRWFRQLAIALSYLHTMNLAHRDIKSENILITSNGNVKLCDFGFSRSCVDSKGVRIYSKTHCGSLAYAAPELIMGVIYDPKLSDMWSLGVVLYAMLNGCLPFPSDKFTSLVELQLSGCYRFRKKVLMRVSKEAVNLVGELLQSNWLKRLDSGGALDSPWLALEPQLLGLSPLEEAALEGRENFTMKNPIKIEENLGELRNEKQEVENVARPASGEENNEN